ncbi:MAG TPA: sensor domain-containing protein [Dehalococcoidia bacterium]|nr:sensor domain-containing protein [Dehalococcoidia bacterium]
MTASPATNAAGFVFGVIVRARTYLRLLYLLLAFPLGLGYFLFLVIGLSLGIGLVVTIVGVPLLVLMMETWRGLGFWEARLTSALLGARVAAGHPPVRRGSGWFWRRLVSEVQDPRTWTSLLYLFLMLPLGTIYFAATLTLLSSSLWAIGAPAVWPGTHTLFLSGPDGWHVDFPFWSTFPLAAGGLVSLFVSLHVVNLLGWLHGRLAEALLTR